MPRSPKSDWLTLEETAWTLGASPDVVRGLLQNKKLLGRKKGRRWQISAAALCVFIRGGGENPAHGAEAFRFDERRD
ncbi:MAG TPA: helix-turn-helix domain-containing protein [Bryobacteraceae bacterium]|jgi:hypothetical protein